MVHDFTPVPTPQREGSPGYQNQQHDQVRQNIQHQQVQYYAHSPPNKRIISRIRKNEQPSTTRPRRVSRTHATNACTKCRERKTKCTADQPCRNCSQNRYECKYTVGKRERARLEREALELECKQLRDVVEAACRLTGMTEEQILATKTPSGEQSDDSRALKRVKRDHPIAGEEAKGNEPHSSPSDTTTSFGSGVQGDIYVGGFGNAVVNPGENVIPNDQELDTFTQQWLAMGSSGLFSPEVPPGYDYTGYGYSN
ncbi:hypothetical protein BDW69DRAFT_186312 [Aspergillus filifer]